MVNYAPMISPAPVRVIGGGLAGCEAAWQLARRGVPVILQEMKPARFSPAHHSPNLAEIVCSNSLKSDAPHNPAGILKAEMRGLGSLLIHTAETVRVPAGEALAIDRDRFAAAVTAAITAEPGITIERSEALALDPGEFTIAATGPLTSDALAAEFARLGFAKDLYFYDAISPIVDAASIDHEHAFFASRYGKGSGDDYLNCPLTKDEYLSFRAAVLAASKVTPHEFENPVFFEGCLPLEVLAARGEKTLAFGPFKPVGLTDPRTGRRPYAALQLRAENRDRTAYSLVACQTRMTWAEQARVFRLIPALRHAEFLRYGTIHRNTYVDGPRVFTPTLAIQGHPRLRLAGQITGVEGYTESMAMGLLAALFTYAALREMPLAQPPPETALGALLRYVTGTDGRAGRFDPMNIHAGLFPPVQLPARSSKPERRAAVAARAAAAFTAWKASHPACLWFTLSVK